MFELFNKTAPLLRVEVDGRPVCEISRREAPCEKTPSVEINLGAEIAFIGAGKARRHHIGDHSGWLHLSVRVHQNLACQADCAISQSPTLGASDLREGKAAGIRFQPFFLAGSASSDASLIGRGLFARGLHFPGSVTPGNVTLSCLCDVCDRSFPIQSFHSGFSDSSYFYSESGAFTLVVNSRADGAPTPLSTPDATSLGRFEASLPAAPDGTRYAYLNPFRCPHCGAAFIDFRAHPEQRPGEYYGNHFPGTPLQRFTPEA